MIHNLLGSHQKRTTKMGLLKRTMLSYAELTLLIYWFLACVHSWNWCTSVFGERRVILGSGANCDNWTTSTIKVSLRFMQNGGRTWKRVKHVQIGVKKSYLECTGYLMNWVLKRGSPFSQWISYAYFIDVKQPIWLYMYLSFILSVENLRFFRASTRDRGEWF